jgi:hypothetical protein
MYTTLILVLLNDPRWQGIAFLLLQTNGKGKVVPVTKAYGGVEVQIHYFLTSAFDCGELLASCSSCFTTGESANSIH